MAVLKEGFGWENFLKICGRFSTRISSRAQHQSFVFLFSCIIPSCRLSSFFSLESLLCKKKESLLPTYIESEGEIGIYYRKVPLRTGNASELHVIYMPSALKDFFLFLSLVLHIFPTATISRLSHVPYSTLTYTSSS